MSIVGTVIVVIVVPLDLARRFRVDEDAVPAAEVEEELVYFDALVGVVPEQGVRAAAGGRVDEGDVVTEPTRISESALPFPSAKSELRDRSPISIPNWIGSEMYNTYRIGMIWFAMAKRMAAS